MGANNSSATKCSKSGNEEIKTESKEFIKCLENAHENYHKDAEIRKNQYMLMEQFKLMEKHYNLIEYENLVKEKLEQEKVTFEIEKKKQQNKRDNHERILQEKELKLFEERRLIEIHSKQIEKREAEVDSLLKSVVSFDIERHLKTQRPIKPFDHHVRLQEGNIENGSGVIRKRLQTPQPIRRNQSVREVRRQNRKSMLCQQQVGFDKVLEYPPPLLSIEIPQHVKHEVTKVNVSKRCGQQSTKRDVNLSRRNTWNCGRNYQLNMIQPSTQESLEILGNELRVNKEQQNERDNHERILREKELKLIEERTLIHIHSKQIEKREDEVDSLLKSVVSFDIEKQLKAQKPIKPFDHRVKLQESNIENGSGVIRKRLQTPQPMRRNQSSREIRRRNREEAKRNSIIYQRQGGCDSKALEYPPSLLSIEIPQHIKDEATNLNVSKRCGQRSAKRDVNQSRRNTCSDKSYQLSSNAEQDREQIMSRKYKCPQCERVWTSSISYNDTNQKCENCVKILPSTQETAKKFQEDRI